MNDKTVKLTTCNNSFDAQLLQSKLLDAGIPAMLANEHASIIYGGIGAAGVEVFVFERDYELAREVMEDKD